MDVILNEYLHEHAKIKLDVGFKVIYEPCDNQPSKGMTGTVYHSQKLIQTFYVKEDREIVLTTIGRPRNKVRYGYFLPSEKTAMLYWENDPDEHFLCVSYEFGPTNLPKYTNWLQEGF